MIHQGKEIPGANARERQDLHSIETNSIKILDESASAQAKREKRN
jgi:hypothetical protein